MTSQSSVEVRDIPSHAQFAQFAKLNQRVEVLQRTVGCLLDSQGALLRECGETGDQLTTCQAMVRLQLEHITRIMTCLDTLETRIGKLETAEHVALSPD